MKKTMKIVTIVVGLLTILGMAVEGHFVQKSRNFNVDANLLALDGYDPVAYFKDKKAVEGNPDITAEFEGVKYRFASVSNKNLFLASPASYEAQYGGWCAYAMGAEGEKVDVDPETFKIVDGKLYLFYNRFFNNTLETWNKNEPLLKANADKNWNKLTRP